MFFNQKTNDKQPDIKGTIVLPDGQEYRISAWKKDGNKGEYYSLAVDTYNSGGITATTSSDGLPF
jgi:hypothetical protein